MNKIKEEIMKLKNLQIMQSEQVLMKLKKQELPILVAYKLNKVIKALDEKLKFIKSQRDEIIKRYGKEEENGSYMIDGNDTENVNKYFDDYNLILEVEEEVEFEKLDMNDFVNVKLTSDEVGLVSFLFEE